MLNERNNNNNNVKMKELVSIIIPLYNKVETIQECINSVLAQNYPLFELLIIDDGSTDNSSYKVNANNDNRISYFYKKNGGVSSSRNRGVKEAKGEWILFLDADDFLLPNALEVLLNLAVKYPDVNIHVANYFNHYKDKDVLMCKNRRECVYDKPLKFYWKRMFLTRPGNTLYNRLIFEDLGGFDERISRYEDLLFNLKVLSQYTVSYSPIPIFKYNHNDLGLSLNLQSLDHELLMFLKPLSFESKNKKRILFEYVYSVYKWKIKERDIKNVHFIKEILIKKFGRVYICIHLPFLFVRWKLKN